MLSRPAFLLLGFAISGCYGAIGPTFAIDTHTGHAALGVETTVATLSVVHEVTIGKSRDAMAENKDAPDDAQAKIRSSRTYVLWEPSFGLPLTEHTEDAFWFTGMGASIGESFDHFDDGTTHSSLVGGFFASAGKMLVPKSSAGCSDDTRAYGALVVGYRAGEFYITPKIGLATKPSICLSLGSGF